MKKKLDLNQLAKSIVEQATGEIVPQKEPKQEKKTAQKERSTTKKDTNLVKTNQN